MSAEPNVDAALAGARRGDQASIRELVDALTGASLVTALFNISERLAELGQSGRPAMRELQQGTGLAAIAGVRAAFLESRVLSSAGVDALRRGLESDRLEERRAAAWVAGEIGASAHRLTQALIEAATRPDRPTAIAAKALAQVGGETSIPMLSALLARPGLRLGALEGLAVAGCLPLDVIESVAAIGRDRSVDLPTRLTALRTTGRCRSHQVALRHLASAVLDESRWIKIGATREIAGVSRQRSSRDAETALGAVHPLVADPDLDVRRNALWAVAMIAGRNGVASTRRRTTHFEDLDIRAHEADAASLGRRSGDTSLPAMPISVTAPNVDLSALDRRCPPIWQSLLAGREAGLPSDIPKWQFLAWIASRTPNLLHGSNAIHLDVLNPTRTGVNEPHTGGDRVAVFATSDPFLALYYAVASRKLTMNRTTNSIRLEQTPLAERRYLLGLDFVSLAARPFMSGTVYVLPKRSFLLDQEWIATRSVRPIASVPVTPDDFPLLPSVVGVEHLPSAAITAVPLSRELARVGRFPVIRSGFVGSSA
jgi:hypothetical protein